MKYVVFAVLSSLFLAGCTGPKDDSSGDSAVAAAE